MYEGLMFDCCFGKVYKLYVIFFSIQDNIVAAEAESLSLLPHQLFVQPSERGVKSMP